MDHAHEWTDREIERLEKRMRREYAQAAREMRKKQEKALSRYAKELEAREKALDATREAKLAHEAWLRGQATGDARIQEMVEELSQAAHAANVRAAEIASGRLADVYAENANWAMFSVERAAGVRTSFSLVNRDAVERLMVANVKNDPIIPEVPDRMAVDKARDIAWNRRKFTSAVTQGIMQGEGPRGIVARTAEIFNSNGSAAMRAARTAVTGAQNAGRTASYRRANEMGLDVEREWVATQDDRTRDTHAELDGEVRKVGEAFSNGCRYPGDPSGDPGEVWNCRCTIAPVVDGRKAVSDYDSLPDDMTYDEWKRYVEGERWRT